MSLNTFAMADAAFAAPETGTTFLRHALKIWAREQGVSENNLAAVVGDVLDFAQATIREGDRGRSLSA